MPKIFANGINFHYQTRGEGPDVILVHGVTSSLAAWYNGIFLSMANAGFKVTVFDLRGHGLSDMTPSGYTSRDMAGDLEALMDVLGIQNAILTGHSFGGAVAMHFAVLHPERTRGVVLFDSAMACLKDLRMIDDWGGWNTPGLAEEGFTLEYFKEADSQQDMSEFLRKSLSAPRQRGFKRGENGLTPRLKKLLEGTTVGFDFREVAGLTEDCLRQLKTPVLALYGESSPNRKMGAHLAAIMPSCVQIAMPGGHFSAYHNPALFVEKMLPFAKDPQGYVDQAKAETVEAR